MNRLGPRQERDRPAHLRGQGSSALDRAALAHGEFDPVPRVESEVEVKECLAVHLELTDLWRDGDQR